MKHSVISKFGSKIKSSVSPHKRKVWSEENGYRQMTAAGNVTSANRFKSTKRCGSATASNIADLEVGRHVARSIQYEIVIGVCGSIDVTVKGGGIQT
jgi:hypothetical protein